MLATLGDQVISLSALPQAAVRAQLFLSPAPQPPQPGWTQLQGGVSSYQSGKYRLKVVNILLRFLPPTTQEVVSQAFTVALYPSNSGTFSTFLIGHLLDAGFKNNPSRT